MFCQHSAEVSVCVVGVGEFLEGTRTTDITLHNKCAFLSHVCARARTHTHTQIMFTEVVNKIIYSFINTSKIVKRIKNKSAIQ